MNNDLFEQYWHEMKDRIQNWWGSLTDADLDKVGGKPEQFVALLQQKYGYTKEHAENELSQFVESVNIR
jgi:uncharacterized protein YjbJ (UPF0337 family)